MANNTNSFNGNVLGFILAVIIIIVSILCLLYKTYSNQTKQKSSKHKSTQQSSNIFTEPLSPITIPKGLQLWLDSSDISSITFADNNNTDVLIWESKVNDVMLMADLEIGIGRNPNRSIRDAKYPQYHHAQNLYAWSIFFDYQKSAKFNKKFEIQTIISLHSFEKETAIQHDEIHGYHYDQFNNFYIFTSNKHTQFHGGSKRLISNAALSQVKNGKIRLDANEYDVNVKDIQQWEGGDVRIAIMECNETVHGINRIGADRKNHHFAGSIIELIVYNRVLNDHEKRGIQRYLINKYYAPYYQSLISNISLVFTDSKIVEQMMTYLIEPSILSLLTS